METIVVTAPAEHGIAFSTLAVFAIGIVAVGIAAWQIFVRSRTERDRS